MRCLEDIEWHWDIEIFSQLEVLLHFGPQHLMITFIPKTKLPMELNWKPITLVWIIYQELQLGKKLRKVDTLSD